MDAALAYILSFWGIIEKIVDFYVAYPVAGTFFSTLIFDAVITWCPLGGKTNGLAAIAGNALIKAFDRKGITLKSIIAVILGIGMCCVSACSTTKNADGTTTTTLSATAQFAVDSIAQDVGYYGYKLVPEARISLIALCTLTEDDSVAMQGTINSILAKVWTKANTDTGALVCMKINQVATQLKKAAAAKLPDVEFLAFLRNLVTQVCVGVGMAGGKLSAGYERYDMGGYACLDPRLPGIDIPIVAMCVERGWNGAGAETL